MTSAGDRFVILGAGQAGSWVARTLRREGFEGAVTIFGDEAHRPYSRPPLSKEILAGEQNVSGFEFLTIDDAALLGIEVRTNQPIERIDTVRRLVFPADGEPAPYEKLFITTGSRARKPAWMDAGPSGRVLTLRTLDDALLLRDHLLVARSLIIIGGGWIGLEVAATARQRGLEVTVLEAAGRLCMRSAPSLLSDWFLNLHSRRGVAVRLNSAVAQAHEENGIVTVQLESGEILYSDVCVVGTGNIPNAELAERAGLKTDNGVVVDAFCRTSDPDIYAAGDVANFPCALSKRSLRRESWSNAQNQAIIAAKSAMGTQTPYADPPWLWSDQFGYNIQLLGLPERGERWLRRGRPDQGAGTWLTLDDDGAVLGAISINNAKDLREIRKNLLTRAVVNLGNFWEYQPDS